MLDSEMFAELVAREEILRQIWGINPQRTETRTIDMHIMHLRTKLRDTEQCILTTVRGKGYRLDLEKAVP